MNRDSRLGRSARSGLYESCVVDPERSSFADKTTLWGYLEHGAVAVKSTEALIGNSIEVAGGVPDQATVRIRAVSIPIQNVQYRHFTRRIQLEYRSVVRIRIQ